MIIPFVYNILKRHPALMVMIHRVDEDSSDIGIYKLGSHWLSAKLTRNAR